MGGWLGEVIKMMILQGRFVNEGLDWLRPYVGMCIMHVNHALSTHDHTTMYKRRIHGARLLQAIWMAPLERNTEEVPSARFAVKYIVLSPDGGVLSSILGRSSSE